MLDKSKARELMLQRKREKKLTWQELGKALGRDPVYVAMLLYGYGQATEEEAEKLVKVLELPPEYEEVLMEVPMRTPAQPWPPQTRSYTDSTRRYCSTAPLSRTWPTRCSATG